MKKAMRLITILLIVAVLAVPVYAAIAGNNFTPSVTQKGSPRIINFRDSNGDEYPAVIVNENGEIIAYIPEDAIKIVSLAEASRLPDGDHVKTMLTWGYKILSEKPMAEAVPGLAEALKAVGSTKTPEDMVVYELFHIYVAEECEELLAGGNKLMIKLAQSNYNVKFEMAIHATDKDVEWVKDAANTESFKWYVMDADALSYDEAGVRILALEEPCTFGLMTDKK